MFQDGSADEALSPWNCVIDPCKKAKNDQDWTRRCEKRRRFTRMMFWFVALLVLGGDFVVALRAFPIATPITRPTTATHWNNVDPKLSSSTSEKPVHAKVCANDLDGCTCGKAASLGSTSAFPIPYLTTDNSRWEVAHFLTPKQYESSLDYILVPHGVILDRIDRLVEDVADAYAGSDVTFVCVLKGASIFFHEFLQAFMRLQTRRKIKVSFDFIRVKSYSGIQSTGQVQILGADQHAQDWRNKHIVFVEDIVDTGLTMSRLSEYMREKVQPASMKVISLLQKRLDDGENSHFTPDFVGFSVPNVFVVGYGLDYNESFRDIPHLCVLNQNGIDSYKQ